MPKPSEGHAPIMLCYDSSDGARAAIEESAVVLGPRPAVVLTVFESLGSALLRHATAETELERDFEEISKAVVDELDSGAAKRAEATAREGAETAAAAGFDAQPLTRRAVAKAAERDTATIWRAILDEADGQDCVAIVVGSRGLSGLASTLLGSVSYGLLHHSTRPVLVTPPPRAGAGAPSL